MNSRDLAALAVLTACTALAGTAFGDGYVLTDLGALPGGGDTIPYAINNHGQVVGHSGIPARAFLWENGVMTDLGTLGGRFSYAKDINDLGQVVGFSDKADPSQYRAFLWEGGVMTELPSSENRSAAYAINNAGQIAGVTHGDSYYTRTVAIVWEGGDSRRLIPYGHYSFASDINDGGEIVGEFHDLFHPSEPWEGFIGRAWGDYRTLGSLGGTHTSARAINEAGQVVGTSSAADGSRSAFLWEDGRMEDIGTPFGFPESFALSVNEGGEVAGGLYWTREYDHALVHRGGSTADLDALTACGAGLEIRDAFGINDSGQIVVTYFDAASGALRGGLLTPSDVVPCRKGNVGLAPVGGLAPPAGHRDVLFVGGSSGDPVDRRLSVGAGSPVTLRVVPSPDARAPHYAVWIEEGESRDCTDVVIDLARSGRILLGRADRCLPLANTLEPGSCAGPGSDLFGLGRPAGVTSRNLSSGKAELLCLNAAPGFPLAPIDFSVTFPAGTFTVYSIVRDPRAVAAIEVSVGNSVVVDAIP